MALYKEIVTKTIIGKGKKYFKNNYTLTPSEKPTTILGCWVINHKFNGYKRGEQVGVDGSFDINIWYSYENDSKTNVVNKKIDYNELFSVKTRESIGVSEDTDIIVRSLKQPSCSKVNITDNGDITFDIEKELGIEVVGEAKVKISVEEDEDPWDEIDDVADEKVLEEIDEKVEEKYI